MGNMLTLNMSSLTEKYVTEHVVSYKKKKKKKKKKIRLFITHCLHILFFVFCLGKNKHL